MAEREAGEVMTLADVAEPEYAAAHFWGCVDRTPGGCWEYTGAKNWKGYGTHRFAGRMMRAHRVAYLVAHGRLPRDLMVLHSCHNRACCNPVHLSLGDHARNMRERRGRGIRGNRKLRTPHVVAVALDLNLTIGEAAERAGVTYELVYNIRRDERKREAAEYQRLLEASMHSSYGGDDDEDPAPVPAVRGHDS